jgi:hypothetical protein
MLIFLDISPQECNFVKQNSESALLIIFGQIFAKYFANSKNVCNIAH